jgi:nitroreductase
MEPPSPAEVVRPLLRVHQVREFTDEPVDEAALDAMADAARWSGSSKNSQPWRFVIIRESATLRTIHDVGLPSTRSFATARAAIAIAMPEQPGRGVTLAYDEGRAAERILAAASMLGVGAAIAWIVADARPTVARLLEVPDDRFVRTIVASGHPTENARQPRSTRGRARLPREETVRRTLAPMIGAGLRDRVPRSPFRGPRRARHRRRCPRP